MRANNLDSRVIATSGEYLKKCMSLCIHVTSSSPITGKILSATTMYAHDMLTTTTARCNSHWGFLSHQATVMEPGSPHPIVSQLSQQRYRRTYRQKSRLMTSLNGVSSPTVYTPTLAPASRWARHRSPRLWKAIRTRFTGGGDGDGDANYEVLPQMKSFQEKTLCSHVWSVLALN